MNRINKLFIGAALAGDIVAPAVADPTDVDPNFHYPKSVSQGGTLPEIGDITEVPIPKPTASHDTAVSLTVAGVQITTMYDAVTALQSWKCDGSPGMDPDATWDMVCTKNATSIELSGYKNGSIISTDISIK